jgi:hypothetical protein
MQLDNNIYQRATKIRKRRAPKEFFNRQVSILLDFHERNLPSLSTSQNLVPLQ